MQLTRLYNNNNNYYYYYYFYLLEFFTSVLADGLSLEIKWQQVSSSLQDSSQYSGCFQYAVIWMVSTRPPTSKSSRPFNNPLIIVPKAPITIGKIVTFIFHSFFQFSSKVEVLISLFPFFQFHSVVSRDSKVDNFADFLFLVDSVSILFDHTL